MNSFPKNIQYAKFCAYGFFKNLRFFDAFLILFLVENGMTYTQIGLLYAVREIITNIFEIPSGILADTYGRKNALVFSFVIYILAFALFYFSSAFWYFIIAFVLYGIGDAFRSGTHKGMIMDYLKLNGWEEQKINYYGHTRSWSQRGSAISSLIAGFIVFYTGQYEYIFLYSIIPYMVVLLLILSYPEELNHSAKVAISKKRLGILDALVRLFGIVKQPDVLSIINNAALHSAYLKAVKDYIQPLMVHVALLIPLFLYMEPDKKNGIIIGFIYFLIYLGTSQASRMASAIEMRNKGKITYMTMLYGLGFGIACGVFYHLGLWVLALVSFIGIYIVENLRKPILTGYITDHVPNETLTSVLSAQSLLRTILTAILAFVFGILADLSGIGLSFVATSSLLLLLSFLLRKNVAFER